MGIGTSIFLIAVGAILAFAVNVQTTGIDLHMIGIILLVVGIIGALMSAVFWSSWGGFRRGPSTKTVARRRRRVIRDEIV